MLAIVSLSAVGRQSTDLIAGIPQRLGLLGSDQILLNQECSYLEAVDSYTVNTTAPHYCSPSAADLSGTGPAHNRLLKTLSRYNPSTNGWIPLVSDRRIGKGLVDSIWRQTPRR
jgi:hypothetical protein